MGDYARRKKEESETAVPAAPGMEAFWAGVAKGATQPLVDPRVPGKAADPTAMLPYIDHDHDHDLPADVADKMAALNASVLNAELDLHRRSKDPNAKYKIAAALERADDSATRKHLRTQHAATHRGQTLEASLRYSEQLDTHGKKNALALISSERDATTDKIAAMDPEEREALEDRAAQYVDQLAKVTRSQGRDDSEHADKVAAILGPRTPEELERIRARVRLNTSGTEERTLFEETDRTFNGRDQDIAMAGLEGDHVKVASTQLVDATMERDADRVHRIVKDLGAEKLAQLRATNPVLLQQIAAGMPSARRAEIEALLAGQSAAANGARIASMLRPADLSATDALDVDAAKQTISNRAVQAPEQMIAELQRLSPAELEAARDAWDKGGHDKTWAQLIAEQYKDADSTVRLRIEAASRGDLVGERALRLRQGMATFDQALIDQALANPDLQSKDPAKRSAAQAEQAQLEARMREYDAGDQRTRAMIGGERDGWIVGRGLKQQLAEYYGHAKNREVAPTDLFDQVEHAAEKDVRMERTREKARADHHAAMELTDDGVVSASTRVRRAELRNDTMSKVEILEGLDSEKADSQNKLSVHSAEYARKFGGNMLAAPDTSTMTAAAKIAARATGDEVETIASKLAIDDMNIAEQRMHYVREKGSLADRTREERVDEQRALHEKSASSMNAGDEMLAYVRGGTRGSEDYYASNVKVLEQGHAENVDAREWARRDNATTEALSLQREEKQRTAAEWKQIISIAAKIAAILTANPALFVAVDLGFNVLSIAVQEAIANEAYEMSDDIKHAVIDLAIDMITAKLAGLGKGLEAGTQAAKDAQRLQRLGTGTGAAVGAGAHAGVDGQDQGAAVFYAALGATGIPQWVRGKAEGLFTGAGGLSRFGRAAAGTVADVGTGAAMNGGDIDAMTWLDAGDNTLNDRLPRRMPSHIHPEERARREAYYAEHGHTGSDLHSHFMGVASVDDFAKQMGTKDAPMSREEMLEQMVTAVRDDKDYAKHYSVNEAGEKVFDHTGGGIDRVKGGHAFDNVKNMEDAMAKIDELRKQPPTPENDSTIRKIASTAVDAAMNSTKHTPYDGGYSIRDTMVKAYIDPQPKDGTIKPYSNFMRMTLEALERDGVLYSEQSQSVKKLSKGNVPYEVVRAELDEFNRKRAERGEPPIDLRFLAMIETRFLGAEGSTSSGSADDWKEQLDRARELMKRGDVMGVDFASPETSDMAKGGKQLESRFEQLAIMLAEEGKAAGRTLTLRPHVGEGYIEMPRHPATGDQMVFDADHSNEHYGKARSNLDALIANVDRLTKVKGADGKPIYDPDNPAFEIRFGHATHATPEQAAKMARLGIKVEVNLGSNAISGALQDHPTKPQGRGPDGHAHYMDDHSLLSLAGAGVEVHIATDAQAVMKTGLQREYQRAAAIISEFRGDPERGFAPKGVMPVTREVFVAAHPQLDPTILRGPYELSYSQLPAAMKKNIDTAYARMVEDSMQRQAQTTSDDTRDARRNGQR